MIPLKAVGQDAVGQDTVGLGGGTASKPEGTTEDNRDSTHHAVSIKEGHGAAHGRHAAARGLRRSLGSILVSAVRIFGTAYGLQAALSLVSASARRKPGSFATKHLGIDKACLSFIAAAVSGTYQLLDHVGPGVLSLVGVSVCSECSSKTRSTTIPTGTTPATTCCCLVRHLPAWWWSAFKGTVTSLWLVLDPSAARRTQLALSLMVRVVYFSVRAWINHYKVKLLPLRSRKRSDHGHEQIHEQSHEQPHEQPHEQSHEQSHEHSALISQPSPPSSLITHIAHSVDRFGVHLVWLFNAYWICSWSFISSHLLPRSYFKSILFLSSSRDRLGPDYEHFVKAAGILSRFLSTRPLQNSIAQIPATASSQSHLQHLLDTVKPTDAHAHAMSQLTGLPAILSKGVDESRHASLVCAVLHPYETACETAALRVFGLGVIKLVKIYTTINSAFFAWSLLQHFRHRFIAPSKHYTGERTRHVVISKLRRLISSTARSVFSFSMYLFVYGVSGWIASPTMLMEKQDRFSELNTYLSLQVLNGFWRMGVESKWWKYTMYSEMMCIVPSMAALAVILDWHPHAPQGVYGYLIHRFFETTPTHTK
ncbi:hypothetical protein BSLG_009328 [Batrachochytrium salamandrivorans]|nr:hypothetical protein BSLG_009328 [Batrachochytrium salamandrivorans]